MKELAIVLIISGGFSLILLFGGLFIDYTERRRIRDEKKLQRAIEREEVMRRCELLEFLDIEAYDKHGKRIGVDHYTINNGA